MELEFVPFGHGTTKGYYKPTNTGLPGKSLTDAMYDKLYQASKWGLAKLSAADDEAARILRPEKYKQEMARRESWKVVEPISPTLTQADVTPRPSATEIQAGIDAYEKARASKAASTKAPVVKGSSNYISPYEAGQGRDKSEVIAIQKQLGVKADGKWGPKTQAAYEAYANRNGSKNSAENAENAQLPTEGLAATAAPKEVGFLEGLSQFWERLFQDDRTPEQRAAEQQAVVDKILGGDSGNTGLAAAQYGR